MSQNPQQRFIELGRLVTGMKISTQKALVSGESTFDLPALSIDSAKEALFHLSAIFSSGPLQRISPASWDDGGTDAQNIPAQDMVVLSIISGVAQYLIPVSFCCRLTQNRSELRRILRGTPTDEGSRQKMSAGMTCDREFRPLASVKTLVATAPDIVTTDVTAFQTSGIDGNLGFFANEFALPSSTKNDC